MEVKIGVTNAPRELSLELSKSADDIQKSISTAIDDKETLFVITDDKGRTVFVPLDKLAYIELAGETGRRVGFGAA